MRHDRIGVQLYTLRVHTADDMEGTLRRVAEIGYTAVEFAGYGDSTPARIRSVLDELGMVAIAAHVPFEDWEQRRAGVFADLHTLGCAHGVVPSVPADVRADTDAVADLAGVLNGWGRQSRDEGLRFAYHNHDQEFAALDGGTVWDALVAGTDPELVAFELDLYWAAFAGADPAALLRRHGERVTLLHAKDMADGTNPRDAPAGSGVLRWDEIAATRGDADRWYIVEQDTPDDPFDDVRRSLRFLQGRSDPHG